MIGIIGAMDIEIEGYLSLMEDKKDVKIGSFLFYTGRLCEKDVVIAKCGVGKVCAAACTTAMIMRFSPSLIINTGVAGGLLGKSGMKQGDIVIADDVLYHDVDVKNFGYADGQLPGMPERFSCDRDACAHLRRAAEKNLTAKIFSGSVASGDQFICDDDVCADISKRFSPSAVEMESAAIGQACYMMNTPFAILRSISDCADSDATQSFDEFTELAAKNAIELACTFLKDED